MFPTKILIQLRDLYYDDCWVLYAWRLDKTTQKASLKHPPTWEAHVAYFEKLLVDLRRGRLYGKIACLSFFDEPIGVIVVDENGLISIMTSPHARRQGVASTLLAQAKADHSYLEAFVKSDNNAGHAFFKSQGFKVKEIHSTQSITYMWEPSYDTNHSPSTSE